MDTFTTIWQRLKARASAVDPLLCQDFTRDAFNRIAVRRQWSWRRRHNTFFSSVFYNTGTISTTLNSNLVVGVGTVWDQTMVGAQIRLGSPPSNFPTYTIQQVIDSTDLVLDSPWIGASQSAKAYQIFNCYFPVPADFESFYSIVNVTNNYRLWHNLTQAELNLADPQRIQQGITYAVAFLDYTPNYVGSVNPTLQVFGTGTITPVSSTLSGFSFPANSVYTITIIGGGASGTATYQWRQDSGAFSSTQTTSTTAATLSNGVMVSFPAGTYVAGDVFIIQAFADITSGVPRYELWPRPVNSPFVYPYIYIAKLPDLTDAAPALPEFIAQRGDAVLELALEQCAMWPGTDTMRNPYYDLNLANRHRLHADMLINELEMRDDETGIDDLSYKNVPFYPAPWLDGSWLQTHAIYPRP